MCGYCTYIEAYSAISTAMEWFSLHLTPPRTKLQKGRVAEWLMAPVLKTGVPERVSGVRIPPLPPFRLLSFPVKLVPADSGPGRASTRQSPFSKLTFHSAKRRNPYPSQWCSDRQILCPRVKVNGKPISKTWLPEVFPSKAEPSSSILRTRVGVWGATMSPPLFQDHRTC